MLINSGYYESVVRTDFHEAIDNSRESGLTTSAGLADRCMSSGKYENRDGSRAAEYRANAVGNAHDAKTPEDCKWGRPGWMDRSLGCP